ncbi:hypothetical protein [Pseudomonas sp. ZS1P83]
MNIKAYLMLALPCMAILLYSPLSQALVHAQASIQVGDNTLAYGGFGGTEDEAKKALRSNCAAQQMFDDLKTQCMINPLLNLSTGPLPGGSYLESCGLPYGQNPHGCHMEGTTLICTTCKPVMQTRHWT